MLARMVARAAGVAQATTDDAALPRRLPALARAVSRGKGTQQSNTLVEPAKPRLMTRHAALAELVSRAI